jgi:hypothetical protein
MRLVALVFVATAVEAKTIKCPQRESLFTITIPDSWGSKWESDGSLTCMPPNHSKYVSVIPSENANSKAELGTQLAKTAQAAGRNAGMKDLKLGRLSDTTGSNGLSLLMINAQGTAHGKPMVFTLVGFAPRKDNSFTVIGLEPAGTRDKQITGIINSITSR